MDQAAAAIALFEASTSYKDFAQFHIEQARRFKRQLNEIVNSETGKPLAKATIYSRLMALKAFLHWLAGQPGYKSRISYSDADYFNPSANDGRIATARREAPVPSLEQIHHVIVTMRAETDIERRDRALVAFAILTGARDDAMASLSLRHLDLENRLILQDARTVRTKNRKTFTTWFFPVGGDAETIVADWFIFLTGTLRFGPEDPVFPATEMGLSAEGLFVPKGLSRRHWKNADAIRRIFRQAFEGVGLPYFNPHSFRKTLAILGERDYPDLEVFKAWSQNLGHENVSTTLTSYGAVSSHRQAEIFASLREGKSGSPPGTPAPEMVKRVVDHLIGQAQLAR